MNELISMPQFMNPIAQVFKIAVHGDTPLVYLCLNASLRHAVFDLVTSFAKKYKEIIQRHTTSRVSHANTYTTQQSDRQLNIMV
uniref:Uncharacterized protein n=1 Tax=Acrobeloides nanus TaxID=290746 RepID=A0A914E2R6_9BILA